MDFEDYISHLNANIFFREFAFSKNKFTAPQISDPTQESEHEFADHVIWLDDLLITFQIKERKQVAYKTPKGEENWFRNTVLTSAVKQIRETKKYLETHDSINIINERGHTFNVVNAEPKNHFNVILYVCHSALSEESKLQKCHINSTVGFIHIFNADSYFDVCRVLITPAEISEYLRFRESLVIRWKNEVSVLPEQALLGQFLWGEEETVPSTEFLKYFSSLKQERDSFSLNHVLQLFADRITSAENPTDYYKILKELAKLNRNELREIKYRLTRCMENRDKLQPELPYRVSFPRTDCGFVFFTVTRNLAEKALVVLQNYTEAHKYDQRLGKCLGVCLIWNEPYYDIAWCLKEKDWAYNAETEKTLEDFPFARSKKKFLRFTSSKKETPKSAARIANARNEK